MNFEKSFRKPDFDDLEPCTSSTQGLNNVYKCWPLKLTLTSKAAVKYKYMYTYNFVRQQLRSELYATGLYAYPTSAYSSR